MNAEMDQWYRTGAVAKMLDTSAHTIRELARAGLIESQVRKGYRYIPGREVERLKAEGVPPMPASTDIIGDPSEPDGIESERPTRARGATPGLYGEPSEQLIRSKERLLEAEHQEQLRTMQQARKEEEARARRAQQIEHWRDRYRRMATAAAHGEVLANLLNKVDRLLDMAPPFSDVSAQVQQLIDAEMRPIREREQLQRALAEHRQRSERMVQTITTASLGLWDVERDDPEEARELARSALATLPPDVSERQIRATLERAIAPVKERIARRCAQKERVNEINRRSWTLPRLSHCANSEHNRMMQQFRSTLEALPLNATGADLDAAVERVVAPFRAADQQSEAAQKKQRDAPEHIDTRLKQLEQKGRVTFDDGWDRFQLSKKLEQKIMPTIIAEILKDPALSDAQLIQRIAALVDQHYKEFCD